MQAVLIMLPILIYALITAVTLIYVLVVLVPRLRGRREKPATGTAARKH